MKKMNLPSLIFNLVETFLLIGMAFLLKIGVKNTIIVFLTFQISRAFFKLPKHYKDWQKCLIWTLLIFTSMFLVAKVDIIVGILVAIFTAYILSGKADFKSKYQKLIDYIKFNGLNDKLIKAENNLKELDTIAYAIYKRKFRENKTFKDISDELEITNPRIVEVLDKIYFYFIGALGI